MSTETPETPAAATPPTPENVAEMLTAGDNDYHDGNDWKPGLYADGNVVHVGITAYSEDGEKLPEVHFRAVVLPVADLERLRVGELEGLREPVTVAEFLDQMDTVLNERIEAVNYGSNWDQDQGYKQGLADAGAVVRKHFEDKGQAQEK